MSKTLSASRVLLSSVVVASAASQACAVLGSFSASYGYSLSVYSGNVNWCDVSYYNAGAYGAFAGGGPGPTLHTPNSGLWTVVGQAGGFFPTSAQRNAAIAGAPPYPTTLPAGTQPIYIVGDHGPGRTDNSSLAFRNDTVGGSVGPAVYQYTLDTYDTGGPVPSSVTSGTVSYGIYFATSPNSPPDPSGAPGADRFTQSFMDSSGNIGAQWGYCVDNQLVWRSSASGPWNYTGIFANAAMWDGISAQINLTNDTFQLDYYDVGTNTWTTLAPAGTPLGVPMGNFTALRWQLEDGTNGGVGGKNFFDDATFVIPAPPAAGVLGLGLLVACRRRRS
jgi:hypothetical protein